MHTWNKDKYLIMNERAKIYGRKYVLFWFYQVGTYKLIVVTYYAPVNVIRECCKMSIRSYKYENVKKIIRLYVQRLFPSLTIKIIVILTKENCIKSEWRNCRGISLLNLPEKMFGRTLIEVVQELIMSIIWEMQCSFMFDQGCVDQIFVPEQVMPSTHIWMCYRKYYNCRFRASE